MSDYLIGFNPSRGIAIIQTPFIAGSATRYLSCFNPSRGIAIIQTECFISAWDNPLQFQSLTRDSNHSNP